MDDILVLRVENCNDYFASVSASYMRSCYGMSLEELVHTLEPVYSTKLPALEFPDAIQNFNQSTPKLAIPKELWRLVDALWTGDGIREKDVSVSLNCHICFVFLNIGCRCFFEIAAIFNRGRFIGSKFVLCCVLSRCDLFFCLSLLCFALSYCVVHSPAC